MPDTNTKKELQTLEIKNEIEIKNDYIYGVEKDNKREFLNIKQLADKYNLDVLILEDYITKNNWPEEKLQYWKEIKESILKQRQDDIIQKSIEFNNKCGKGIIYGVDIINNELELLYLKQSSGESINHNKIKSLSQALESLQRMGRLIYNEPTELHGHKNEIVFIRGDVNNDNRQVNVEKTEDLENLKNKKENE